MLRLGVGVVVDKVPGAVDNTDVGGCTERLVDVVTLDPELIEVETLDELALIDDALEL